MQEEIIAYFKNLQRTIINAFEEFEPEKRFEKTPWNFRERGGGGGVMQVLRGDVFEKAAVNWSGIEGNSFPMKDGEGPFFACGVSLITHMDNPHAPTAHMNVRFIQTEKNWWFGGGYDLTPMGFPYKEDTMHFHNTAERALNDFGLYQEFAQNAANYFYIPHRKKQRGVGGIFFDHYHSGDFAQDFRMVQSVASSFLDAVLPIYFRRINQPYNEAEKEMQLKSRAHYVEFNLIYDRGTKFGFQSGGNPEAILCSMPPLAKW